MNTSKKSKQKMGAQPRKITQLGNAGELHQIAGGEHSVLTTDQGGAGSVDTPRDVRGFAVKFYTKEGNWDLVGNNIPAPVTKMNSSPALQIIGKMKDTLAGRTIGILIADGSNGAAISKIKKAAINAGASVKIVAPKIGGVKLAGKDAAMGQGKIHSGAGIKKKENKIK